MIFQFPLLKREIYLFYSFTVIQLLFLLFYSNDCTTINQKMVLYSSALKRDQNYHYKKLP